MKKMKKILSILMLFISIFTFSATTWNGTNWSNGIPTNSDDVTIAGNYTVNSSTGILDCKSLLVNNSATLTVSTGYYINIWVQGLTNNGTVIIQSGADILLRNGGGNIINNSAASNFIVEDGGSIVQLLGNATNTGNITIKRNTNPVKRFEYTYWSTPVATTNTNTLPPSTTNNSVYTYTYPTPLPMDGWVTEPTNGNMIIGKGYAIRGPWCSPYPSCFGTLPQNVYQMSFVGIPNNGTLTITSNSTNNLHLIGNPYPSGLLANSFMSRNSGVSALYFWTHNTVLASTISGNWTYNFTVDDYATWNLTGGVGASSPIVDGTPNNTNVPSGNIGTAQGFFVKTNTNGAKTFEFRNSDRGLLPFHQNTQFYRSDNDEKHRIWLFLTNNNLITRYNLIGYVNGADNNFNHQYDAEIMENRVASIYSILDDKDLVIQGRGLPFDNSDIIPLGYKLPEGGSFQIGLNDVDGLFTDVSQPIYLEDLELGVIHNLRNSNYSFTATTGTNETRFRLRFTNTTLGIGDFQLTNTIIYNNDYNVTIKSDKQIKDVYVYDMLGRVINDFIDVNNSEKTFRLNNNGVYIIKVKLDNDIIITKKIAN